MSDHQPTSDASPRANADPLPHLVQTLVDQVTATRAVWDRIEHQAIPLLERIALALERGPVGVSSPTGAGTGSGTAAAAQRVPDEPSADRALAAEVRSAIGAGHWDLAEASMATLAEQPGHERQAELLGAELKRARERAVAQAIDRIEASRLANDAAGGLEARNQLAAVLSYEDLKAVDRSLIGWLMKLIQRRLRIIPIGADLAALVTQVADRFGATPEGASLRAALPTLRRSAGLCPRCAEPYLGVDDACPQCLAKAGQAPSPVPTLTFVAAEDDELDAIASETTPVDLNKVETWQLP